MRDDVPRVRADLVVNVVARVGEHALVCRTPRATLSEPEHGGSVSEKNRARTPLSFVLGLPAATDKYFREYSWRLNSLEQSGRLTYGEARFAHEGYACAECCLRATPTQLRLLSRRRLLFRHTHSVHSSRI